MDDVQIYRDAKKYCDLHFSEVIGCTPAEVHMWRQMDNINSEWQAMFDGYVAHWETVR